jgi:hypothetical protein
MAKYFEWNAVMGRASLAGKTVCDLSAGTGLVGALSGIAPAADSKCGRGLYACIRVTLQQGCFWKQLLSQLGCSGLLMLLFRRQTRLTGAASADRSFAQAWLCESLTQM